MEQRNKILIIKLVSATFSLLLLCGCFESERSNLVESQPPIIVANNPMPAVISTSEIEKSPPMRFVKGGGAICENYLLKIIAKEKIEKTRLVKLNSKEPQPIRMGRSAENSPIVKLKVFETDNKFLSDDLEKWLQSRDIENLVGFELQHGEKKALILGSNNIAATGIASNFQNWYIRLDNQPIKFLSLSENPKLIFWDKTGLLNYFSISYGDKFLENKDWDNLTLDLLRYRVNKDGKSELVNKESNVRCD